MLHKAELNLHFILLELVKLYKKADENLPLVLDLHSILSSSYVRVIDASSDLNRFNLLYSPLEGCLGDLIIHIDVWGLK